MISVVKLFHIKKHGCNGFQHPARFKGTTFRDLLAIASGQDDEDTLARIISRVGICSMDFLDKPVDAKLSGGEIKKIEIATIIARTPKLAIYDEPDTGIDLWTIQPMVDLIRREKQRSGPGSGTGLTPPPPVPGPGAAVYPDTNILFFQPEPRCEPQLPGFGSPQGLHGHSGQIPRQEPPLV